MNKKANSEKKFMIFFLVVVIFFLIILWFLSWHKEPVEFETPIDVCNHLYNGSDSFYKIKETRDRIGEEIGLNINYPDVKNADFKEWNPFNKDTVICRIPVEICGGELCYLANLEVSINSTELLEWLNQ